MTVFNNYARYYDLLYQDKDYAGEARFIHQLIKNHAPDAQSILELGCGTGNHAVLLAKEGYIIHGVDRSSQMLETASDRLSFLSPHLKQRLTFSEGDLREIRLDQQFDVIISLFHVFSYQTKNTDLKDTFATVKAHLKPRGILIFDCWYGPAVLSDRPQVRVKRLENDRIEVTRIAEPVSYPNDNLVDVNYYVFIKDKKIGKIEELKETHTMRYLFKSEIEILLSEFQLNLIDTKEWMTNQEPSFDTWGVYFVGKDQ